ncbi:type IV pilus twitching motility protein PilT [Anatilimnocola floriformis]|uniref:type IV pilus twitching motility protein PilT n=1 Tax=Anatilimnocola floriformis TaxID=2948575 RepID=UPI0020C4ADE1|nr:PilT/PilU family type 4a pilus ATPase [Anatilimnocola floriformis]
MTSNSNDDNATAALLDRMLAQCTRDDASDVHLSPGLRPYFRIHGKLGPDASYEPLTPATLEAIARELAARCRRKPLGDIGSLDGALTAADGARFRLNIYRRGTLIGVALRRLEEEFRTLADLGLKNELYSLCNLTDGLVVVAGPTGAGKSTTLASLLHRINQSRASHIVTIEDPIEYLHTSLQSLVNQRQVGTDTESFYEALVASLRQDPDVILVGEIRDLNTIRTAIAAAETGHLVFTTVHAGDCVGTIERLVSVFPADEQAGIRRQLSLVLRCIIAQHLIMCDGTAIQRESRELAENNALPLQPTRRRVVTSEVLMVNSAVANLIATGKSSQIYSALETGSALGMHTLEEDLARLWHQGFIAEQTALNMARNPNIVRDRLAARRMAPSLTSAGGRT